MTNIKQLRSKTILTESEYRELVSALGGAKISHKVADGVKYTGITDSSGYTTYHAKAEDILEEAAKSLKAPKPEYHSAPVIQEIPRVVLIGVGEKFSLGISHAKHDNITLLRASKPGHKCGFDFEDGILSFVTKETCADDYKVQALNDYGKTEKEFRLKVEIKESEKVSVAVKETPVIEPKKVDESVTAKVTFILAKEYPLIGLMANGSTIPQNGKDFELISDLRDVINYRFEAEGYEPYEGELTVEGDVSIDIELKEVIIPSEKVKLTIPLADAKKSKVTINGESVALDADGNVIVEVLPGTEVHYQIELKNWLPIDEKITVTEDTTVKLQWTKITK